MNQQPPSPAAWLQDPAPARLEQAAAANHAAWFALDAVARGGEVRGDACLSWTYAGPTGASMVPFPRLSDADAGARLDALVRYYLDRLPERLVGCWSLAPPQPADLEIRLLARGFQLGWQPCWMALDLERLIDDPVGPPDLEIAELGSDQEWSAAGQPHFGPTALAHNAAARSMAEGRLWRFAARSGGRAVGHSAVFLTAGPLGVAGLYDVEVAPEARNRGIGTAVTAAACKKARQAGCRFATLNATGERMYSRLGFQRIGYGLTWWLDARRLARNVPSPERVALTEAAGRGDVDGLESQAATLSPADLDAPLPNGMTLLELAVHGGHAGAADWLVGHGATLDVVSAWDLGQRGEAAELLRRRPELANRPRGETRLSPLHVAVERGDADLARLVLAAGPDLTVEDSLYRSTALGWARHLGRADIAALIEQGEAEP